MDQVEQQLVSVLKQQKPIKVISHMINTKLKTLGLIVDPEFHGHYIGKKLHEEPTVFNTPNYYNTKFRPGVFTIEPHCTIGHINRKYVRASNISQKGDFYIRTTGGQMYSCLTDKLSFFEQRQYWWDKCQLIRIT